MVAALKRVWDVLAAILAAFVGCAVLSEAIFNRISTDLITFYGVQVAVILPAMIFTAGVLRPEGVSLFQARRYQAALRKQMVFWVTLLVLDFVTVGVLIVGEAVDWTIIIHIKRLGVHINISVVLYGLSVFLGSLAIFRTIPFIKGVMSLQALNGDLTEMAIIARERAASVERDRIAESNQFKPQEGYGQIVSKR
jgi:hypothetical protein